MADRTIHYEAAFEGFLRDRGIPCVAVDEAKKALFANARLKSFDFVVYSKNGPNLLVDVIYRHQDHILLMHRVSHSLNRRALRAILHPSDQMRERHQPMPPCAGS